MGGGPSVTQHDTLDEALELFRRLPEEEQLTCLARLRSLSAEPAPEPAAPA